MIWALLLIVAAALVFLANRYLPPPKGAVHWQGVAKSEVKSTLCVMTWNMGFAGQNATAEMFFDGGKYLRPLDRTAIQAGADDIARTIGAIGADINLLQEDARGGFLTRGVDLHDIIRHQNSGHAHLFWPDMRTWFVPQRLGLMHGLSILSRLVPSVPAQTIEVPQDPIHFYGAIKKFYGGVLMQTQSTRGGCNWVVINVHLSAFDKGAKYRQAQLQALLDQAQDEYTKGNAVIIGGDWNMTLGDADFAHQESTAAPASSFRMTKDMVPQGWQLVSDNSVPTNRSVAAPFKPGVTRTTVLDGFLTSPNVRTIGIETKDLSFRSSDHQPVIGQFEII